MKLKGKYIQADKGASFEFRVGGCLMLRLAGIIQQ